ncbi:hypothetical protein VNI00_000338 [Paramarasmius palmivorus]|uniref:Uncharacterized protein n=1 Tax=Paramarasmius palmivorus TaxID=297713 RepID=A0AAW0EEX9_9AGAR
MHKVCCSARFFSALDLDVLVAGEEMPDHSSVVFQPLRGSGRVIYEAEDTNITPVYEPASGYGTFKSFSKSVAELDQGKPRQSTFRVDFETADSKRKPSIFQLQSPPRTRKRTMSCDNFSKAIRCPRITIPCTQVVRNIVKSRSPSSSASEPHFEIVTPVTCNVDVEIVVDRDDDTEKDMVVTSATRIRCEKGVEMTLAPLVFPALPSPSPPIPNSAPPSMETTKGTLLFPTARSDSIPGPDPPPMVKKKPRPLPVPPVVNAHATTRKKCTRSKRLAGVDVHRDLPPLPTA